MYTSNSDYTRLKPVQIQRNKMAVGVFARKDSLNGEVMLLAYIWCCLISI